MKDNINEIKVAEEVSLYVPDPIHNQKAKGFLARGMVVGGRSFSEKEVSFDKNKRPYVLVDGKKVLINENSVFSTQK